MVVVAGFVGLVGYLELVEYPFVQLTLSGKSHRALWILVPAVKDKPIIVATLHTTGSTGEQTGTLWPTLPEPAAVW